MSGVEQLASPLELVRRFSQLRVLVVGDAMLDTYLEGEATRLCSEGPVPVVQKTQELRIPGGAANVAANVRALGAQVALLSVIGSDEAGNVLRATLSERGIEDCWLVEDAQSNTLHKLRISANGQYIVRFDEGGKRALQASPYGTAAQHLLADRLNELYANCDAVLLSDYCYGTISEALIEQLCALQRRSPRILLVDSKALQRFRELPVSVITPNHKEARLCVEALKKDEAPIGDDLATLARIAHILMDELTTGHVAVTLAERGVFLLDRSGSELHLPAHQVPQANDVGAGDSFAAALILTLAAGGSMEDAARIALDAAGIAVTRQYTAMVQQQELLQRVSMRIYASQAQSASEKSLALAAQLELERIFGRTIVFTNGVFDILHAGHVEFLRQAKALGDVLVVAVNSDRSARRLKGAGRPINAEHDRLALVAALDMVDYALLFDEDLPSTLITTLRPHLHVKGGDYASEALPEAKAVEAIGGKVVILPLVGSVSTSSMIERIVECATQNERI